MQKRTIKSLKVTCHDLANMARYVVEHAEAKEFDICYARLQGMKDLIATANDILMEMEDRK
jgi:hypothetical protein